MNLYPLENQPNFGCISGTELQLNNQMRLLWEQHVFWTRLAISGIVFASPDSQQSSARLLRNPKDFATALEPYYGKESMDKFADLFTSHLTIAAQLVTELKNGDTVKAAQTEKNWYENADQIAAFLAQINPHWNMREWQEMLYNHLHMTKNEVAAFLSKDYETSVSIFDKIEQEALEMADIMTGGLMAQFYNSVTYMQ